MNRLLTIPPILIHRNHATDPLMSIEQHCQEQLDTRIKVTAQTIITEQGRRLNRYLFTTNSITYVADNPLDLLIWDMMPIYWSNRKEMYRHFMIRLNYANRKAELQPA